MFKKVINFLLEATQTITISLSIFVMIYLFIGRPTEVLGYSMEPNLKPEQRLIVENVSLKMGSLKRGDIVVLHSPTAPDTDYVKRIVGMSGDSVIIKDCSVYINDSILPEPYLVSGVCTNGGEKIQENREYSIPDNDYLVMGDNREHSYDGRFFGLIPKSDITGRAIIRWWPPNELKVF